MFIPISHNHAEAANSSGRRLFGATRSVRHPDVDAQTRRLGDYGAGAFRATVLLLGGIELAWRSASPGNVPLLTAASLLAATMLLAGLAWRAPLWLTLLADGAAVMLLVLATGGAASPFLTLILALILQGGLLGGERDAAAGAGAGLVALLLISVLDPAGVNSLLIEIAMIHAITSILAVWWIRQARMALAHLRDDAAQRTRADQDWHDARRAIEWQRQNLAALGACNSTAELLQRAAERAAAIAGTPATPDTAPDGAPGGWHVLPLADIGRLIIRRTPAELTRLQRDALDHLAEIARQRAEVLRSTSALQRHHDALAALWEVAGMLRAAPDPGRAATEACRRIATALDLDWLAFLGLDQQHTLAPLLLVRGGGAGTAPRLHAAQLRVAAEALRGGRSLVRAEQGKTLACLPVRVQGETSFVLAARGMVDEAALQALLMLFGDLVAERLVEGWSLEVGR